MAGHRFVDRVVDDFVHQVVQAAQAGIADVHARAFANMLEVAQMLELLGAVFRLDLAIFGHVRLLAGGVFGRVTRFSLVGIHRVGGSR